MEKKTSPQRSISNKQKAALLMLSLDVEAATRLMKGLSSEEIEFLTVEIASLKGVHSLQIDSVIEEFHQLITAQEYVVQGGWEFAQKLLETSLGPSKARSVMDKVKTLTHVTGFAMLKKADPKQLASFLQKEHPQTIALVLSNLSGDQTAGVLSEFPDELRNEVVFRIATLGKVSPTLLTEIEDVLSEVAEAEISQNMSTVGGTKSVANVLNKINNATAKGILEFMESKDGNLANEVKRLMFMFEDLVYIDDRGIQRLLREVDKKDLALSMKVADDTLKEKIFKNMSERAQELLKEELQFMGPVRLKEVEAAQTRIVMIIRQLEDSGELVVAGRGGKEEVIV
ncbi:MAG TPA: flagellar motor switch protein FliG [Bacteroidota bacterium]|nr:flagellar motor switch protein FliG [Bacteroidota bacterium]